jgi:hypothetical protein
MRARRLQPGLAFTPEVPLPGHRIRALLLTGALAALGCQDPAPTTGSLQLTIDGLPSAAQADVFVTGPNSFSKSILSTSTLEKLAPGEYTVRVRTVAFGGALYASDVGTVTHTIVAGNTAAQPIPYALASGSIELSITGLPIGVPANIQLQGPTLARSIVLSGTIGELPPGQYTIRADTMASAEGDRYGANTFVQMLQVTASLNPIPVGIDYALVSGTLAVTIDGLPTNQTPAPVTITGPSGFMRSTSSSVTYRGLTPGSYAVNALKAVGNCPFEYTPSQPSQVADVTVGGSVTRGVTYTASQADPQNLNLRIDAAHLVQVTQDFNGTVPMIAGKAALLRVFAIANQCNTAMPQVRVTLSNGIVHTLTPTETAVRLTTDQAVLAASYNVLVPDTAVKAGLTLVAEIDPTNTVTEADETDNRFPATGTRSVGVRVMPATGLRFVPVTQSVNGATGSISAANMDAFLEISRKLHPVSAYDVDIREPYTTSRAAFQNTDQNGSWSGVLSEVRALRAASADNSNRYYYGVVKVTYNSGVAGIGFIGQPAAIGWDYPGSAGGVMAHELGHNFGRFHTPCGNPAGIDQNYPNVGFYSGGFIGTYGYDIAENTVKNPQFFTDVMGYCNQQWISDYTYMGMMNWLTDPNRGPTLPIITSSAEQPSLLIWGRIINGEPMLEPAFEITTRPQLPATGPHRIVATDASGAELFSVPFAGDRIADLPGSQETFAFTVPLAMLRGRTLDALRLTARGRTVTASPSADIAVGASPSLSRAGARAVRVRWDAARFPVLMVRDPVHGHVLSFARGGDVTVTTEHDELELHYSNRVRSGRVLQRVLR